MEKLGNLFEFFVTTGIKTMDQDVILAATVQSNKKDVAILTIFPNPVERKMNPIISEIGWVLYPIMQWCFPMGVKVLKEGDSKFKNIEDYYKVDDPQANTNDLNYFVVNDFKQNLKYYCTSAIFYEKMFIIVGREEKLLQVYVPKAFCVISKYPAFIPQRSFVVQLLKIQRLRMSQNSQRDKVIKIQRGNKEYQIEEIKLYDFYIRTALNQCPVLQENVEHRMKFSSSDIWMNVYYSNSHLITHFSIFKLSNNLFDVLIFNQPVFNLFKLHIYMMLEYQIIIVSRKTAGITLFCQSMLELMAPLQWRGLYIPFLRPGTFDFQKSTLPYIIGLDRNLYEISEKPLPKDMKRVIYDIDDGRILTRSDDPKCPKMFQNYLIRKLNLVFADLKFYENEYFEEGILRYRQAFYNFKLILLNDIYKYFSSEEKQSTEKKVVLFDYKKFLASFDQADQPFFLQFLKTLTFQTFVKELYKVMQYREDFISNNLANIDYNFAAVLQFFDDMRFLSIRFNNQSLDDKTTILETLQDDIVKSVLQRKDEQSKYQVIEMKTTDFIPEYLEHLKGSSLNLSTEMANLARYIQENRQVVEEVSQGGPVLEQDESVNNDRISQVSSQLSNEEVIQGEQNVNKSMINNQNQNSVPSIPRSVNWDISTIGSHKSQMNKKYQVKSLNLIPKKSHFRKKNHDEGEEDEDSKPEPISQNTFILTNLHNKMDLNQHTNNLSNAAKSYFNKSMMPLIGDYGNPEIMVRQQNDMI